MQKNRRRLTRFDVPLEIKFRSTYGAKEYFTATARDLSLEGLRLDADDFRFILNEHLEMILGMNGEPATLFGDVTWKKQNDKRCIAGIRLRMKDATLQQDIIKKLLSFAHISPDLMHSKDTDHPVRQEVMPLPADPESATPHRLGFIKHYQDNGDRCKVTFRLLRDVAGKAERVMIVGDFNDWDTAQSPMTRLKNGDFVITIELDSNKLYRFGYLIDGKRWENDRYADRFVKNWLGVKVSVVYV